MNLIITYLRKLTESLIRVFLFFLFFNLLFLFTKTAAERKRQEANNSGPGGSDQKGRSRHHRGISCKWDHTVFILLRVAYFT